MLNIINSRHVVININFRGFNFGFTDRTSWKSLYINATVYIKLLTPNERCNLRLIIGYLFKKIYRYVRTCNLQCNLKPSYPSNEQIMMNVVKSRPTTLTITVTILLLVIYVTFCVRKLEIRNLLNITEFLRFFCPLCQYACLIRFLIFNHLCFECIYLYKHSISNSKLLFVLTLCRKTGWFTFKYNSSYYLTRLKKNLKRARCSINYKFLQ